MKGIILSLIIFLIVLIIVGLFYFFWWRKRNMSNEQKKGIEGGGARDVEKKDSSSNEQHEQHENSNTNSGMNINERKVNDSVSDKNKSHESNESKWNDFKESKRVNINKIKNDVEISKPTEYLDFNELFVQPTTTDDSLYDIDTINGAVSKSNYDSLIGDISYQNSNDVDVLKLNDLKDFDKREFKNIESVLIGEAKKQTVFTLSGSNELF